MFRCFSILPRYALSNYANRFFSTTWVPNMESQQCAPFITIHKIQKEFPQAQLKVCQLKQSEKFFGFWGTPAFARYAVPLLKESSNIEQITQFCKFYRMHPNRLRLFQTDSPMSCVVMEHHPHHDAAPTFFADGLTISFCKEIDTNLYQRILKIFNEEYAKNTSLMLLPRSGLKK